MSENGNSEDTRSDSANMKKPVFYILGASFIVWNIAIICRYFQGVCDPSKAYPSMDPLNQVAGPLAILLLGIATAWPLFRGQTPKWSQQLNEWCANHTQMLEEIPDAQIGLWIALAAGLGLYMELMMIHVHASMIQLLAHFKNVSLISCFLGLGIGYAKSSKSLVWTPIAIPLLAIQVLILKGVWLLNLNNLMLSPNTNYWNIGLNNVSGLTDNLISYGFLIFLFVFNTFCFIPLGQLASKLMKRRPNLIAYN